MNTIPIQRLHPAATLPTRAHPTDAGLDLSTIHSATIHPGTRETLSTGIAVGIPAGYVGLVFPRSGNAFKHGLSLTNAVGVIDSGYVGEIKVNLLNQDHTTRHIVSGQRIAQLVIVPIATPAAQEVASLEATARAANGFGSSGN
jgi:dUTP pyrophosphatase